MRPPSLLPSSTCWRGWGWFYFLVASAKRRRTTPSPSTRSWRGVAAALLALLATPATAQQIVTSPAADSHSVSIYRDPNRGEGGINSYWPNGFALITETRTVTIPAGEAVIRFEGVADSILSESAIVTGLPGGVAQKNRDLAVLSPAALIDFAIGKRVSVRRTVRATGETSETEAFVRAGPGGGIVIESASGVEALQCAGLPEALVFDRVPEGLSDKPVLSVVTRGDRAVTATLTVSYLAGGFDWAANYVARLDATGAKMDLFAWATLASGAGQSFPNANTSAIAGKLKRTSGNGRPPPPTPLLTLGCWPLGTTSDIDEYDPYAEDMNEAIAPPPPPPPVMMEAAAPMAIVVTGSRIAMRAQQEELGDLKLYRIPEPVTVAAKSQKQVAMIDARDVPIERFGKFEIAAGQTTGLIAARRVIRTKNVKANNLGLALPAGAVELFAPGNGTDLLAGKARMRDLAVGEEVELETGLIGDLRLAARAKGILAAGQEMELTLTNAQPTPQSVEVALFLDGGARLLSPSTPVGRKDGQPLWKVGVPANGTALLTYIVRR